MYTITVLRTPRPIGQAAKTAPSHGANPGSIPGLVMKALSYRCSKLFYYNINQVGVFYSLYLSEFGVRHKVIIFLSEPVVIK